MFKVGDEIDCVITEIDKDKIKLKKLVSTKNVATYAAIKPNNTKSI